MNLSELNLDGMNVIGVFGYQIYREKYDHIYILFEGGTSILIKTKEILIDGGEVYEILFSKVGNPRIVGLKEIFKTRLKIQEYHAVRRDEWYTPIHTENGFIGGNPRSLNWGKPSRKERTDYSVKTVDCGLLLCGLDVSTLFYTSDYPGCVEATMDKKVIGSYMETADLI
jgi:hypothetical protein